MPTGYTYKIEKGCSFEEFVLGCAKAFGACVTMRDDESDAPIPEQFEVPTYHKDRYQEIYEKLREYESMSSEEAEKQSAAEYQKDIELKEEYLGNIDKKERLYQMTLECVNKWVPPTPGHYRLKDFMENQIKLSMDHGNARKFHHKIIKLSGELWLHEKIKELKHDLDCHAIVWKKEIKQTNKKNEWIKQLRDSLK